MMTIASPDRLRQREILVKKIVLPLLNIQFDSGYIGLVFNEYFLPWSFFMQSGQIPCVNLEAVLSAIYDSKYCHELGSFQSVSGFLIFLQYEHIGKIDSKVLTRCCNALLSFFILNR